MRKVLRYKDRDIIRINQNGRRQGFYRSTGRNSKRPNEWLPFDGITCPPWFDKTRFCSRELIDKGLERFGTEENKKISEKLNKQSIPQGIEASELEINLFLKSEHAKDWMVMEKFYKDSKI